MASSDVQNTSSSPFGVIATVGFWDNNYKFFIILGVCLLAILIMSPYMLGGGQGVWVVLSILTILICFYGIYRALYEISKIEIENSLIKSISEKAGNYNRQNKSVELDELRNEISPPNETNPTPAMIRLIEHVVNEAKISRFDSSINLLQPYREEAVDIIFKLQHYQKIVLWIGIGGTFIGILKAIQFENLQGMMGKSPEEFGNILTAMFNNLSISFRASLAGLVAAVVLGWFILLIKKKQEVYFKNMESVVTVILTSARKSINKDRYLDKIESLEHNFSESQKLTKDLQRSIYEMQRQIILQNGQIQESVNKFFESNQRVVKIVDKTEEELKAAHDSIALKNTLQESIKDASRQLAEVISPQITTLAGQMSHFRESTAAFNESVRKHSEQTNNLNTSINSRIWELSSVIRNIKFPQNFFNKLLDKIF